MDGQPIEHIILISDVDGVIRESTDGVADDCIIQSIQSLLRDTDIDVTFISGTPIENDLTLERWRRGNVPLKKVFGSYFEKELLEKKVTIYGVLDGHRMKQDGSLEIVDEYSPEVCWELSKLLIQGFLKEVLNDGTFFQQGIAKNLNDKLGFMIPKECNSSNVTSHEFHSIIDSIHKHLDPNFRLISNGALVETQTSNSLWNTKLSIEWLRNELNQPRKTLVIL